MQLSRDYDREAMQPRGHSDEQWVALCPLAVIRVYQRNGAWHWKIITSRALPFVSRDELKTKEAAWSDACNRLAELARAVLSDLESAKEARLERQD